MRPPLVLALALASGTAPTGVDLAKKYPAALDVSDPPAGHEWSCGADDVWSVNGVKLEWSAGGQKLALETGAANVVLGHEGTSVLWAVVLPLKPGRLATSLPGDGGAVYNAWLRFHPSLLGQLFPTSSVTKNGGDAALVWARRIAAWKVDASWQSDHLPVVPPKSSVVVDVEVQGGGRRFYSVDTRKPEIRYEPAFEKHGLPIVGAITKEDALEAFDDVANAFDREYPKFALHPDYDWSKAVAAQRRRVADVRSTYEVGAILADLLRPLDDLHVAVTVAGEPVPVVTRHRPGNGSGPAVKAQLVDVVDADRHCWYGATKDGIGYVAVNDLEGRELPAAFDAALEKLATTWALVVDLRFDGGGDELLAQQIAGRFVDHERVYSVNRYRAGSGSPKHDDFGPWLERKLAPRTDAGAWRYESPVVVLQGRKTMSSAESLVLMLAQCPQVTTLGDRTAGSSGNPRTVETKGRIEVRLPRWDDRDPQKNPIECVGLAPKVPVASKPTDFTDRFDPVFAKALETLRAIPEDEHASGRRAKR
jgi:hypothetical protein